MLYKYNHCAAEVVCRKSAFMKYEKDVASISHDDGAVFREANEDWNDPSYLQLKLSSGFRGKKITLASLFNNTVEE